MWRIYIALFVCSYFVICRHKAELGDINHEITMVGSPLTVPRLVASIIGSEVPD